MSSIIHCPHCHGEFINEPLEEILNPTLTVERRHTERSSWQEIADLIDRGEIHRQLKVGDTISCDLKDGSKATIDVLDINAYGTDEVIFGFHHVFKNYQMNGWNTNAGGFPQSKMFQHLEGDIFPKLPDDLRAVITPRVIQQNIRGKSFGTAAHLWLPSLYEVFGEEYRTSCSDVGEKHYQYFKNFANRIKFESDGKYSIYWWLRSPSAGTSTHFWLVYNTGFTYYYSANSYGGVCPCFSICKRSIQTLEAR